MKENALILSASSYSKCFTILHVLKCLVFQCLNKNFQRLWNNRIDSHGIGSSGMVWTALSLLQP